LKTSSEAGKSTFYPQEGRVLCMKGSIYTRQTCPLCGGKLLNDENRRGCFCPAHPQEQATDGFWVVFGRGHFKRFKSYTEAYRHLTGLRFQTDHDSYDPRDWRLSNPLGFETLALRWLEHKSRKDIKTSTIGNITREIGRAIEYFGQKNIKTIGNGEIEDFIDADHRTAKNNPVSSKSRHDIASTLSQFFHWVCGREKIPMPEFPAVSFELGWRSVVEIQTQMQIIEKVRELCSPANIKIYLGIKWLADNPNVRPGELVSIRERQILLDQKIILVRKTKERNLLRAKTILLEDEDIAILKTFPRSLPEVFFFRHAERSGIREGIPFGTKLLNRWWKRACTDLGVTGVSLYPGTKHSTVTALGWILSPEEIKRGGTGHQTNAAFERYMLPDMREKIKVRQAIHQIRAAQPLHNQNQPAQIINMPKL
jgi:integrase